MLSGFTTLIACQLLGEGLGVLFHLPIPGPVTGMLILTTALLSHRARMPMAIRESLEQSSQALIRHMGLLFIPAGVGVIAEGQIIASAWLPLSVGLVGSTVLSLVVTGLVMHWTIALRLRLRPNASAATPGR